MTYQNFYERPDFDRHVSQSEQSLHEENMRANEAFVAAINREIKRGRLKIIPGTFVDNTPHFGARRFYGSAPSSACGSPSAMCMEASGSPSGAQSLR